MAAEEIFLTSKDKRDFINSFFLYYKSGMPLIDSIKKISDKTTSPRIRSVAKRIYTDLNRGKPFDEVMLRYEKFFGRVIIGLLISGEKSGKLVVVLARIQTLLQKENRINNKIKDAMTMPAIISMIFIFVLCVFLFFVFPMLEGRGQVNVITQAISALIKTGIVYGIVVFLIIFVKKAHFVEKVIVPKLTDMPKIGSVIKNSNWANFFLVLYVAYEGGLSATSMLDLASETIKQADVKKKLKLAIRYIMEGNDLSGALIKADAMPEDFIARIATGETTGELDKALNEIITEIDETTESRINAINKMIEPMMIVVCAIAVLILAVNFYRKLLGDMSF